MGNSLNFGTYWGIPVKIHWSFGLMLIFIGYIGTSNGLTGVETLWFGGYVAILFLCVILHEYGHALTARRYGIETQDIIISPIGGIARLQRLPEKPSQELLIALAGPFVNVIIAAIVGTSFYFIYGPDLFLSSDEFSYIATPTGILSYVITSNIALIVFNLIPAFPMDGGRVLRALLSMKFSRRKATLIASIIGRIFAVIFIIVAFTFDAYMLAFIGVFIFIMARAENKSIVLESTLKNQKASDFIRTEYTTFHIGDVMKQVIHKYMTSGEKNFFVVDSMENIVGSLPDLFIQNAFKNKHGDVIVSQYMSDKVLEIEDTTSLLNLYTHMNTEGIAIVGVTKNGQLQGVIDRNIIQDFIKINS